MCACTRMYAWVHAHEKLWEETPAAGKQSLSEERNGWEGEQEEHEEDFTRTHDPLFRKKTESDVRSNIFWSGRRLCGYVIRSPCLIKS